MNVEDYITYIGNPDDVIYLKTPAFPVNMRLFNSSKPYREIIIQCCDYIKELALEQKEGYSKPYGMSGANAGIPFNIIGVVRNRNKENEYCEIMINPVITARSKETFEALSNCGSIRLQEPIKISRNAEIDIEFYSIDGEKKTRHCNKSSKASTIQHEVDHNLGILITDRRV